jgi:geranylgeranyl transferase type-1 subunit beta
MTDVELKKHAQFFKLHYNLMPQPYQSQECNHMMMAYFVVCGLDLLDALTAAQRSAVVEHVYANHVPAVAANQFRCGFRGVNFGSPFAPCRDTHAHDYPHLIMTQCALQLLLTCGDDLSRVDRAGVVASLKRLQMRDGSFCAFEADDGPESGERDIRFSYCAAVVSFVLDDWSGFDRDAAEAHILRCQAYEGGFGQAPDIESHAGSTFCAVAALQLMGRPLSGDNKARCVAWCAQRQGAGFQGRPNKPEDSCYSFWTGGTLALLGAYQVVDKQRLCGFVCGCQFDMGGIAKWPQTHPDALHTFLPLMGTSLTRQVPGLQPVYAALAISERAAKRLNEIHKRTIIETPEIDQA